MNFENVYYTIVNFLMSNQLIAIGIVIALILFLWKSPKQFCMFMLLVTFLIVGFYVITLFDQSLDSSVGKKHEISVDREKHLFQ